MAQGGRVRRASTTPRPAGDRAAQVARPVGFYLLPLRAFLAVTFLYAGLQKLANPAFFNWSSPSSLHSMMAAYARTSPIHALLSPLVPDATAIGITIALAELAVGIGMALGLLTRVAAVGGMCLSLSLFLAVSFHSSPWYTGADIVYLFTFTPFVALGAGGFASVDALLAAHPPHGARDGFDRRYVVLAVVTAAFGGLLAGADAALGRALGGTGTTKPPVQLGSPTGATGPRGGSQQGTAIGRAADVPVGSSGAFTIPSNGDPGLVIHTPAEFVAYDAVCPHLGCTVGYYAQQNIIACPCHGSTFNVLTGAVEGGPAPHGLTKLGIADDGGELYVT